METKKPKAGRPPKSDDERLIHFSVRLTEAQIAKVRAHGFDWLRALIDRAKPPKPYKDAD